MFCESTNYWTTVLQSSTGFHFLLNTLPYPRGVFRLEYTKSFGQHKSAIPPNIISSELAHFSCQMGMEWVPTNRCLVTISDISAQELGVPNGLLLSNGFFLFTFLLIKRQWALLSEKVSRPTADFQVTDLVDSGRTCNFRLKPLGFDDVFNHLLRTPTFGMRLLHVVARWREKTCLPGQAAGIFVLLFYVWKKMPPEFCVLYPRLQNKASSFHRLSYWSVRKLVISGP